MGKIQNKSRIVAYPVIPSEKINSVNGYNFFNFPKSFCEQFNKYANKFWCRACGDDAEAVIVSEHLGLVSS